jgi:hypothetical protein
MADPTRPTAVKLYGRENWIILLTVTASAPTVAQVTSGTGLDVTNMVFVDGAPDPQQSTNLVDQVRRFGDTTTTQFVGTTTHTGGQITYQFNPQGAAASTGKRMWEKLLNAPGTVTGYLVNRQGIDKASTPVAGEFVDVYPVEFGPSKPTRAGSGENAEGAAMCTFAITSAPTFNVAIV